MWVVLKQVRSVSCADRRTGTEPHEEIKEDDDLLTEEVLKLFQTRWLGSTFFAKDRPYLSYSVKELMRKVASPRARDLTALKRVARADIYGLNWTAIL